MSLTVRTPIPKTLCFLPLTDSRAMPFSLVSVYLYIWKKPIAIPPWDAAQEGADSADWAQDFINRWESPLPILYAGSYAVQIPIQPNWPNVTHLIDVSYNQTVKDAVQTYNQHLYALSQGTDLAVEMDHARTAADLAAFPDYVAASASVGREFYIGTLSPSTAHVAPFFSSASPRVHSPLLLLLQNAYTRLVGETGFHGQEVPSDASFGAALQILDKSLLATSLDVKRLYYHQGTINQGECACEQAKRLPAAEPRP